MPADRKVMMLYACANRHEEQFCTARSFQCWTWAE